MARMSAWESNNLPERAGWLAAGTAVLLLAVRGSGTPGGTDAVPLDWDRYQAIVDREPFGHVPKPGEPGSEGSVDAVPEPEATGPGLEETVRLSMVTQYGGTPAAGFTDTTTGRSFYLYEGQTVEDFTLVSVEAGAGAATLRKGTQEARLVMGGGTAPATPAVAAVSAPPPAARTGDTLSYAARQRQRVEEARARAEEARRKAEEERRNQAAQVEKLTGEALQKHLREYNMELIRTGSGPPLPIELTPEEVAQLAQEGFDVGIPADSPEPANPAATPATGRRRFRTPASAPAPE